MIIQLLLIIITCVRYRPGSGNRISESIEIIRETQQISRGNVSNVESLRRNGLRRMHSVDYFIFDTKRVEQFAAMKGLTIIGSHQGIYVSVSSYPVGSQLQMGLISAFLRPIPRDTLHIDALQVRLPRQGTDAKKVRWSPECGLITFIILSWAMCWAHEKGSKQVELLVVKDANQLSKILVRLYSSFGFEVTREITDVTGNIEDELIWGQKGTIMTIDLEKFFEVWTSKFQAMFRREEKRQQSNSNTVLT